MRRLLFIVASLFTVVSTAFAVESLLQTFTARSSGASVTVEWRTSNEASITSFEIERAGSDNIFRFVSVMPAKGPGQPHSYVDEEVFAKADGVIDLQNTALQYRLKMIRSDKSYTYSNTVHVTHSVSGIKRTWGMIKEMFR